MLARYKPKSLLPLLEEFPNLQLVFDHLPEAFWSDSNNHPLLKLREDLIERVNVISDELTRWKNTVPEEEQLTNDYAPVSEPQRFQAIENSAHELYVTLKWFDSTMQTGRPVQSTPYEERSRLKLVKSVSLYRQARKIRAVQSWSGEP